MSEVETRAIRIPAGLSMRRTDRRFERVIREMTQQGWKLIHSSRVGGAGGNLTFQREVPTPPPPHREDKGQMSEVETRAIRIPAGLSMRRTDRRFERVIREMTQQGWKLIHSSRVGGAGGTLTFQREVPTPPPPGDSGPDRPGDGPT